MSIKREISPPGGNFAYGLEGGFLVGGEEKLHLVFARGGELWERC